ncbi:MAG: alpha/beta hydrolase [Actinomycetota bacterium]|nr:alpha/beta hydrolase [Actinomycetota bacterium]
MTIALVALGVAPSAVVAAAPAGLRCDEILFSVALAPGQEADFTVVGWLCSRGRIVNKTIQVLLHGATYDHNYWDFPYRPDQYSYVRAATVAGYATLNMDRLGHGRSSRVAGDVLDLNAGAFAVHQIIQDLRSGEIVSNGFGRIQAERILLAGESIGGNIAWLEAGTYQDVDGLLVAGSAHVFSVGFEDIRKHTVPVETDPLLGWRSFPPGYFTTRIGTRGLLFYYEPNTDPTVILVDEILKQTITLGENTSVGPTLPVSRRVNAPTLITVGDFDDLFCDPPSCTATGSLDGETANYGAGSCAELTIVSDAGHNLNLHRNAPAYFDLVQEWADRRVGPSTLVEPPPRPCQE